MVIRPYRERTHERDVGGRGGLRRHRRRSLRQRRHRRRNLRQRRHRRRSLRQRRHRRGLRRGLQISTPSARAAAAGQARAAAPDHARAAAPDLPPQRQAQMRRPRRPPLPARRPVGAPRPTPPAIKAVRSLDLETKVELDSLRRAVEESNRRANRATLAAVASTAVDQGLDSFRTNLTNQYVRAGARFAPLLLLSPKKKKGGVEGFVTDPRFIGGASILGIALLHNFTSGVHSVVINPRGPVTAPVGTTGTQKVQDTVGRDRERPTRQYRAECALQLEIRQSGATDLHRPCEGRCSRPQ